MNVVEGKPSFGFARSGANGELAFEGCSFCTPSQAHNSPLILTRGNSDLRLFWSKKLNFWFEESWRAGGFRGGFGCGGSFRLWHWADWQTVIVLSEIRRSKTSMQMRRTRRLKMRWQVNGWVVHTEVSESEGRLAVKYSPSFLPSISRAGLSSWKKFDGGRMGGWHRTKRLTVGRLCNTFRWKSWQLQISTHQLSSTLLQSWCGPLFSPNLLYVIWESCKCLSVFMSKGE